MATKYPKDVAVSRAKQTLSIASYLFKPDVEKGESPKTLFGHFSRYIFTVINEQKQALAGNISPLDVIGPITKRSEIAYAEEMRRQINGMAAIATDATTNSEAPTIGRTTAFFAGEFKGKTPVQVLLEHPDGSYDQKLQGQFDWLKSNVERYPKNKTLMDAIQDAFRLKNEGKLNGEQPTQAAVPSQSFVVYQSGYRPNMYKGETRNGTQMYPVFEIDILWNFGKNYPVDVSITRYFAPVEKKDDGRLNVTKSAMDRASLQKNTMHLAADEWIRMLKLIECDVDRFNMLNAKKIETEAEAAELANKQSAGQSQPQR